MDGIIVINKEKDLTSFQVVNIVRKTLGLEKAGHVGTLDPLASGVLVVCLGEATKLSPFLTSDDKEYECEILIGEKSDTEDITGKILESRAVTALDEKTVDLVLESLIGPQKQLPPMYSAVKVNGKKLYEYARRDQEVERKEHDIIVYEVLRTSPVVLNEGKAIFSFKAHVSKGTYIRTLCVEIGERLGYPALMSNLRRTKSGKFTLVQAVTLDDVRNGNYELLPMLEVIDLPQVEVSENYRKMVENGMTIKAEIVGAEAPTIVFKEGSKLIGIYEKNNLYYKAVRLWK